MTGPIVVVHIPKTAGTTFAAVLRRNYPRGEYFLPKVFRREDDLEARLRSFTERPPANARFLRGHMPLTARELLPADARFVTFLREPVARTYSHYRHVHTRAEREGRMPPVEAGLEHEYLPDNLQARMLCGLPDPLTRPADDELLAAALRELRALAFFGVMERFPESMLLAQRRLGLRHVAYRRVNVRGRPVPDADREALAAHNRLDVVLYRHALDELAPSLDGVDRRRARALAQAGEALTRHRPVASALALRYVADYAVTEARVKLELETPVLEQSRRWRRWRVTRSTRSMLRATGLWR